MRTLLRLMWFPIAMACELATALREMFEEVLEEYPLPRENRK